ncbi:hypothetical protein [Pelagibius sp. 7325]|uniref:hypothetical protein n=1 Tax=Pelagibius sp. 7325 TaxID=3131994 RepID=UPI0030EC5EF0
MKWSQDLGIAVALTVVVWSAFYFTFPSEPFSAMETIFVLVVLFGLTKFGHWAWNRWGAALMPGKTDPK